MSNHEEVVNDIRKQIGDFQTKIDNLSGIKGIAREEAVGKHEKHLKRIKRLMETYQYSIQSGAFQNTVATHKSQYKEFQLTLNRLEKNLQNAKFNSNQEIGLFKNRKGSANNIESDNNRQMVIKQGDEAQAETLAVGKRIQQKVAGMHEQADEIMTQMDRQIKKLDSIYDTMSDTQTTLKRAQAKLKYFAKQLYTDRIVICLIIVMAIAIIVIIGLSIAGKTPKVANGTIK